MNVRIGKHPWLITGLAVAALVLGSLHAQAQPPRGPGGPAMTPQDAQAAWTLQAKAVAHELGLNEEQTAQLAEAYVANRRSNAESLRGLAGGAGGDPAGRWQAMQEANDASRAALKASLGEFLDDAQSAKAVDKLGTYSRQGDYMVHLVAGYDLDEASTHKAVGLIAAHVAEADAARAEALEQRNMQAMREATQASKAKLDTEMAKLLNEEQAANWAAQTAPRGFGPGNAGVRGGGPGGPGPRGEGGVRPRGERPNPEGAGPRGQRPRGGEGGVRPRGERTNPEGGRPRGPRPPAADTTGSV